MTSKPLLLIGVSLCVMSAPVLDKTKEANPSYEADGVETLADYKNWEYVCWLIGYGCDNPYKPKPKPKPKLA